jgi:hypothetical protein
MRFGLILIVLVESACWAGAAAADDNVLCVQQQLAARGLNPGALDGELGARTRSVAQAYSTSQRLGLPTLAIGTAAAWCQTLRSPATTGSVQGATPFNPQRPRGCARYVVDPEDACY